MRILVRLIVMWLIAVALPIQGVAAATMLHCGSAQGQQQSKPANEGHVHHHAGMQSEGSFSVGSHHHAQEQAATAHSVATDPAGHHHGGEKTSCSVCASCCSAAALPAMPLVVVSQDLTDTAVAIASPAIVVFLTDGPERPPRTILA